MVCLELVLDCEGHKLQQLSLELKEAACLELRACKYHLSLELQEAVCLELVHDSEDHKLHFWNL